MFADEVLATIRQLLPAGQEAYLVGGAVRDRLLGLALHDLDIVGSEPRLLAHNLANSMQADVYTLDGERKYYRVILSGPGGERLLVDVCAYRGGSLETDLTERDFTINAMALDLGQADKLLDPLKGAQDLKDRYLRTCREDSIQNDPIRALRGLRQALAFRLHILPETLTHIRRAGPLLANTSLERKRDELFRLLESGQASTGIRLLQSSGLLYFVLPEVEKMIGVEQGAPHELDVWEHSLAAVHELDEIIAALVGNFRQGSVDSMMLGWAVLKLGRYRQGLAEHFSRRFIADRSREGLLSLAALLHDIAKPDTRQPDGEQVHFYRHEVLGAQQAESVGRRLALSVVEIDHMQRIIAGHLRIHQLSACRGAASPRAIHRFFKAAGEAGVEICLLSLADLKATYRAKLPESLWQAELELCRQMLEVWFERPEIVKPARLVSGDEIMAHLQIKAGPLVGRILADIAEAQAAGEVSDREMALQLAKEIHERSKEE
jgi:putative nucleotidyltransferase with HDIG domain